MTVTYIGLIGCEYSKRLSFSFLVLYTGFQVIYDTDKDLSFNSLVLYIAFRVI